MIDIQQLTSLISAFRVETEKSAIKWVQRQTCLNITEREQIMQRKHSPEPLARRLKRRQTVGSILQAIADLLATATSETEYNIIRFWKETKGSCFLFYLAIAGKASLESFILLLIREKNCISLAANDIIIIYLCQNTAELWNKC